MDHPTKKRGPCHPHLYLYQLSHLYLDLIWIDDLRAPSTRKLLALLDIAAAVSANSRVFASQALPTWLGNLKVGGVELGLFYSGTLEWTPIFIETVGAEVVGKPTVTVFHVWGCQRQGCRPFSCGLREDPSIAERRMATATWQYPKSLRPNHGREIEKIQSS